MPELTPEEIAAWRSKWIVSEIFDDGRLGIITDPSNLIAEIICSRRLAAARRCRVMLARCDVAFQRAVCLTSRRNTRFGRTVERFPC
jgi:transposase-like protein